MDWTNIEVVLVWITGMGAPAIVMVLLSLLVENWNGWSTLPKIVKFILPMLASVGLSVMASVLLKHPELLELLAPWFQVVMASIIAYIASQKTYQATLKANYGARFLEPKSSDAEPMSATDDSAVG